MRFVMIVVLSVVLITVAGCGGGTANKPAAAPVVDEAAKAKAEADAKAKAEAEAKKKAEEEAKNKNTLMSGENGILNNDVFVGVGENKDNYDEMFKYITKKNQEALKQMILDGKVYYAKQGTKITCVERGIINAKIQISGTKIRGWVPIEYLAKE